jgi:Icc-related predicted phosphoesterase
MKILCISDQIDPLVYSTSIKNRFADVDIILSAGDLPLDYLEFIVSSLNKPLFFVFGNHHTQEMTNRSFEGLGCVHIGSKVHKEEGLIVAGLGGSIRYNHGANQYTDFQMYLEIIKLMPRLLINRLFHGRFLDILLTHSPPSGIHDKKDKCHQGFKSFLWFIRIFRPKYLVHGHIHLYDLSDPRSSLWMGTTVINAFNHYVINASDA